MTRGWQKLVAALERPVDARGLAFFRIAFGLLMSFGLVRFMAYGWIDRFYVKPTFYFKYHGFSWVKVWPEWGMYLHFGALLLCALAITAGFFYRLAAVLFFLGFTYVELMDASNYLNHYYLISLVAFLIVFLPLNAAWSFDAYLKPSIKKNAVPAWGLYLLRFQIVVVYFFAGMAKLQGDWLLNAQPLNLWLTARTETFLLGPFLQKSWVHYALSWGGFLYDTFIGFLLLIPATRVAAFIAVIVFHGLTAVFFPLGMFPWIMIVMATIFFNPNWPQALSVRALPRASGGAKRFHCGLALMAVYGVVQILLPLRHHLYPGNLLWREEGMRFSWQVMVREKNGSISYMVQQKDTGRTWRVSPSRYLNADQEREMAGQPAMIWQLAQHIGRDFHARGFGDVSVRVEALVALNGRKPALMIDPSVDLLQVEDSFAAKPWILPEPETEPVAVRAVATFKR